jgi:hypothetical protein
MNPSQAKILRDLFHAQEVAALGTLHKEEPYVSMVPFALLPGARFVIHVSTLAAHTKDMLTHPQVSLLVIAPTTPGVAAQELARVTIQGEAVQYDPAEPGYAEARAAYLTRFPDSAMMFGFADFSLFAIVPTSVRFVGGFAQATTLSLQTLASMLGEN